MTRDREINGAWTQQIDKDLETKGISLEDFIAAELRKKEKRALAMKRRGRPKDPTADEIEEQAVLVQQNQEDAEWKRNTLQELDGAKWRFVQGRVLAGGRMLKYSLGNDAHGRPTYTVGGRTFYKNGDTFFLAEQEQHVLNLQAN